MLVMRKIKLLKIKIPVLAFWPRVSCFKFLKHLSCLLFTFLAFISLPVYAQLVTDSLPVKYSFIVLDSNCVFNDSVSLYPFYEKLSQLQKTKQGRVNIVHIGDSHIQADHFSGKLRQSFQLDFGNAGRGFVFPYRAAKTNEPVSYKTSTNIHWQSKRNVFPDQPLPIGISGITIETGDTSAQIKLLVKDQGKLNYGFNTITLFHARGEESFDFAVYDSIGNEIAYINNLAGSEAAFTSVLKLTKLYHQVLIKSCPRNTSQSCAQIFGMLLENDSSGVLYNMIGVNGAMYKHYNLSQYFIEQLPALQPDLVIISLGTNEGYLASFNRDEFYGNIDTLVKNIKRTNPEVNFLLTTPGDSFRRTRRGKVKNPDMLEARNTIIKYCTENKIAYWDLYSIMGGYGSMLKWYKAKLSAKDRLHFSSSAYVLQGGLMYNAIIKSYNKYLKIVK